MHGEKRRVLSLRLKTNGMKGCVLRGKGWLFKEVRIPKNVDIFVYEMMHRGMRHEEVQKLPSRRSAHLQADAARHSSQRNTETPRRRSTRLQANAARLTTQRNSETPRRRSGRLQADAARHSTQRNTETERCRKPSEMQKALIGDLSVCKLTR